MTKFTMENHEFGCEKLCPEHFKTGVCAFKIIDGDKDTTYWVVAPTTLSDQMTGEYKIETPNDGHVCAFCMNEHDALMVASSICIAATMAAKDKSSKKALAAVAEKAAKDIGFDIEKLKAEAQKLSEILKPRMEEFLTRKPDAKSEWGEW